MCISRSVYSGLQRTYLVSQNPARLFNVGAVLARFGAAAFTEVPPSSLTGEVLDAEEVFPGFGSLRDVLGRGPEGPTPELAFAALESFLTARLRPVYRSDARTAAAVGLLAEQDIPVADPSQRLGLSGSTLQRHHDAAAALPPGAAAGKDLLALADYYDQPHLVRAIVPACGGDGRGARCVHRHRHRQRQRRRRLRCLGRAGHWCSLGCSSLGRQLPV